MLGRQNLEVNMHGAFDGSPIWRRNQHLQPKVPDAAEIMHITKCMVTVSKRSISFFFLTTNKTALQLVGAGHIRFTFYFFIANLYDHQILQMIFTKPDFIMYLQ